MFRFIAGVSYKINFLFIVLLGLAVFLLSVVNVTRIDRKLYKYAVVYLIAIFLFSFLMLKIKRKWVFLIGVVILSLTLRIMWILWANTEPVSDFYLLNKAANMILEGQHSVLRGIDYFSLWVYQLGFSVYCSILYSVFGSNILVVKIFNVVFSTGTVLLIYFIAAKIFDDKAARISSLLYAIYIQSVIFNSMLTNQVVSAFFIYMGILIIIYKRGVAYYLLSGISIAIGHIIRPEGSFTLYVIVVAIIFYNILNLLKKKELFSKTRNWKSSDIVSMFSKVVIFVLAFNVVIQLFGYTLKAKDITEYDFGNRNVYWKFVVGLNASTNGAYSNEDAKILNEHPVGEELYRVEKDVIRERVSNKFELAKLMVRKFNIMWTHNDSTIQFVSPGTELAAKEMYYIVGLEKIQFTLILFLVCLTIFLALNSKQDDFGLLIIMILISANFAVYLLVEIQTRYRYFIMPAFFIFSGFGLTKLIELIELYGRNLKVISKK